MHQIRNGFVEEAPNEPNHTICSCGITNLMKSFMTVNLCMSVEAGCSSQQ